MVWVFSCRVECWPRKVRHNVATESEAGSAVVERFCTKNFSLSTKTDATVVADLKNQNCLFFTLPWKRAEWNPRMVNVLQFNEDRSQQF